MNEHFDIEVGVSLTGTDSFDKLAHALGYEKKKYAKLKAKENGVLYCSNCMFEFGAMSGFGHSYCSFCGAELEEE